MQILEGKEYLCAIEPGLLFAEFPLSGWGNGLRGIECIEAPLILTCDDR